LILVIDNYDSFTYNLVQYLRELGSDVDVRRNDAVDAAWVEGGDWEAIVVSPGPGRPEEAGISEEVIGSLGGKVPILGVCLGHQAIARVHGARIVRAPVAIHGKTSRVRHDGRTIFRGLPNPFEATRYHSLTVAPGSLPGSLEVSASAEDDVIMGLRRPADGVAPLEGVQFHPESILTTVGRRIVSNFLDLCRVEAASSDRVSARISSSPGRRPPAGWPRPAPH
jgi:anthranilate synthase/aminodeoxychorismate synthase-like glutamine amidotransferase